MQYSEPYLGSFHHSLEIIEMNKESEKGSWTDLILFIRSDSLEWFSVRVKVSLLQQENAKGYLGSYGASQK